MNTDNLKTDNKIYPGLAALYNEICRCCGKTPNETPEGKLFVNYKDDDKTNQDIANLQLLCNECINLKFLRDIPNIEATQQNYSPEMKKNLTMEPLFRAWLRGEIETKHKIPVNEAINSGAEFVNGSTETIKRYLKKLTSNSGNYRIVLGQRGIFFIEWKE